jgi:hypothetical protein
MLEASALIDHRTCCTRKLLARETPTDMVACGVHILDSS